MIVYTSSGNLVKRVFSKIGWPVVISVVTSTVTLVIGRIDRKDAKKEEGEFLKCQLKQQKEALDDRLEMEAEAQKKKLEEERKYRLEQEEQRKRQVEIDLEAYRKKLEIEKKNRLEQFEIEKKRKEQERIEKERQIRQVTRGDLLLDTSREKKALEKEAFDKVKFLLRAYTGIPALAATLNLARQCSSYGTVDFLDIQNLLSAVLITGAIIVWSDTNSIVRRIRGKKKKVDVFKWRDLSPNSRNIAVEDPDNLKILSGQVAGGAFTSDEEKEIVRAAKEEKKTERRMLKVD